MTPRKAPDLDALEALLARAKALLPAARASFQALVRSIADQLPDPRRARDVGRMLDEIARGKLYRLGGHATFEDFVGEALGISRATAYRLRRIAQAPEQAPIPKRGKVAAYEAARAASLTTRRARPTRRRAASR